MLTLGMLQGPHEAKKYHTQKIWQKMWINNKIQYNKHNIDPFTCRCSDKENILNMLNIFRDSTQVCKWINFRTHVGSFFFCGCWCSLFSDVISLICFSCSKINKISCCAGTCYTCSSFFKFPLSVLPLRLSQHPKGQRRGPVVWFSQM